MKDNTILTAIKTGLAAVVGVVSYLLGGFDPLIYALCAVIAADYITGIICAIINKELDSNVGFYGLLKKGAIFLVILLSAQLDKLTGSGSAMRTAAILFYIANEGLSILENLGNIGMPVPSVLKDLFARLKDTQSIEKK